MSFKKAPVIWSLHQWFGLCIVHEEWDNYRTSSKVYRVPPKTNMTGWNIYHEWRCISYWKWGFSNVMLVFRGVHLISSLFRCKFWLKNTVESLNRSETVAFSFRSLSFIFAFRTCFQTVLPWIVCTFFLSIQDLGTVWVRWNCNQSF